MTDIQLATQITLYGGVAFLGAALLVGIATAVLALIALHLQAKAEREALRVKTAAESEALKIHAEAELEAAKAGNPVAPNAVPEGLPGASPAVDASWLDALARLLDSVAKAPAWLGMFLCGFALLWLSITLVSAKTGSEKEAAAPKENVATAKPASPSCTVATVGGLTVTIEVRNAAAK